MEQVKEAVRRHGNSEMSDGEFKSDCLSELLDDLMTEEKGSHSKTESEADNNSEPAFLAQMAVTAKKVNVNVSIN